MEKKIKTEIISTIKSKEDLETFFETLTLAFGKETILELWREAYKKTKEK